jgi:carbon monoxide dehydrogenase subunit G
VVDLGQSRATQAREDGMPGVTVKKHIAAPQEKVLDHATDIAKWPERMEGIVRVEMLTPGPVSVGTRFRETRVMFKREATEEMEVTGFDRPHSYAVGAESHGCKYRTEFTFKPNSGGTDVEMVFEATPVTVLAKTMSAMMKPMLGKMAEICGKDLDDLKASIESS